MDKEVIGISDAGGRGAALVDAYGKSPHVDRIVVVPGNDMMPINLPPHVRFERHPAKLAAQNARQIAQIFKDRGVTLADICQDDVVAGGLVNELQQMDIDTVGPTKEAGEVEWNKIWSREFQRKYGIPHPDFWAFQSKEEGIAFLQSHPDQKWVVKAAGLAQGKGVIMADNKAEAMEAIHHMNDFGEAGSSYLLEECLEGEEFSGYGASDGSHYQYLGGAQDHKRAFDGDQGPNTGGMGCISSPLILTPDIMRQVHEIFRKAFDGMVREGRPYKGILYLGGIVVNGKVYVIEFNARWGDPEAQVILPGLKTDLVKLGHAIVEGRINDSTIETDGKIRVAVAMTSRGYPGDYSAVKGKKIIGIEEAMKLPDVTAYGAGIKKGEDGHWYADGGRQFYIVGKGDDAIQAQKSAYDAMSVISVEGDNGHYRTDIGGRDVRRLQSA